MRFKIGEKVTFMHESGYGIVQSYTNDHTVVVEDETGFDRTFPVTELVKIHGDLSQTEVFPMEEEYELLDSFGQNAAQNVTKFNDYWEIDLHSHMIMDSEKGLSNNQIFTRQMYEFKRFYKAARAKMMRKLIVIHGVGEGVLKNEIRNYLEGQTEVEFYDASYREYGKGATEVRLYYNY